MSVNYEGKRILLTLERIVFALMSPYTIEKECFVWLLICMEMDEVTRIPKLCWTDQF